jgi:hypothetical protein
MSIYLSLLLIILRSSVEVQGVCRRIGAKVNKALDEVRAGESRRTASEARTPLLKQTRWFLLKREENLTAGQRFRCAISSLQPETVRACLLEEAFQQFWDYSSPAWAGNLSTSGVTRPCVPASSR